jgi:hypothetical protein
MAEAPPPGAAPGHDWLLPEQLDAAVQRAGVRRAAREALAGAARGAPRPRTSARSRLGALEEASAEADGARADAACARTLHT